MPGKRRFGRVRELPSGRWQARYKGPDGIDRPAPSTFDSKTSAERWLTLTEAEIIQDAWIDPDAGSILFGKYAADWIEERPGLRPKTTELYRYLLRRHLSPTFDARPLAEIREPQVRRWRKNLLDAGVSAVTVAKAYRLLKAIFNTAVDDGLIRRHPCRVKGAGQEKSAERPVLTVPQVYALAAVTDERYRVLVLLAAFTDIAPEALEDGIRFDFFCGVYGSCTELRAFLEARGQAYVLRVPRNFRLSLPGGQRLTCADAAQAAAARHCEVRSAGTGARGQRWYGWSWLATASPTHCLLIRRHLNTGELAFHYCFVPEGQPVTITRLIRAAGLRWPVEEQLRAGKDLMGLDESQVRLYPAIARHTVLVMAALAICAVTAAQLKDRTDTQARPRSGPGSCRRPIRA